MKCVNIQQMRELDRRTIEEYGVTGAMLMEQAGIGAAEAILEWAANLPPRHVKRFICLAGAGNNGGDAYVVARCIYEHTDYEVVVYATCPVNKLKDDARYHAKLLPEAIAIQVKVELDPKDFMPGDILIDGLLGTGFSGPLRAPYNQWIRTVNQLKLPTVALDMPSGLNSDDGTITSDCILADLTVTIGLPKYGLFKNCGPEHCGLLKLAKIGIPKAYIFTVESEAEMIFADDVRPFLDRIPMESYKNIVGRVLVCGGSTEYRGAPLLAAETALRGGAGMVYLMLAGAGQVQAGPLSLITRYQESPYLNKQALPILKELAEKVDAIVCGPGMGRQHESIDIIRACGKYGKPVVYDADALALIAQDVAAWSNNGIPILTPHPGEMKMLLDSFCLETMHDKPRDKQAGQLARVAKAIIVLKGRNTVVAHPDGRVAINSSGCPALSGAGSGDCLAGLIGAFVASPAGRSDIFQAVCAAVFIHGLAGELNPAGIRGAIADDLPALIPEAMRQISPFG